MPWFRSFIPDNLQLRTYSEYDSEGCKCNEFRYQTRLIHHNSICFHIYYFFTSIFLHILYLIGVAVVFDVTGSGVAVGVVEIKTGVGDTGVGLCA